ALLVVALIAVVYFFLRRRWRLQNELKGKQAEARRLKELDHFKSRLYTNLTHEFRTPLTVILGMTRQLREDPTRYLEEGTRLIESNGRGLLRLINQLLDLSKLENNALQLHWQQGDIIRYLRYLTEAFQSFANSKELDLRFTSPCESLTMDLDPEQLKQVLTNLLSNALKFTPAGGRIDVRVSVLPDVLELVVSDTGIGIPEADLPYVFDRFYQVDSSSTRQGEGTGIGLAHTQELVQLMGGRLEVSSILHNGTIFIVRLPISRQASVMTADWDIAIDAVDPLVGMASADLESQAGEADAELPQLLIIEDNPDVVAYLQSCLDGRYQLLTAPDGQVGIERALDLIPDLIISDVMMPRKDGYAVCDTLKQDHRTSHIPIILLTARGDEDSKLSGLRRGADAYLTKPFNREELLIRLEMLHNRQRLLANYFRAQLTGETFQEELSPKAEADRRVEDAFIQEVRRIVADHYADESFALPALCEEIGMSRSQLFRKMKALLQVSPSDYIRSYRLLEGKKLLETTDLTVSEVAWRVGFKDLSHFSRSFHEAFGYAPSETSK
ncbi:MAG: helix-turn-helix domain-containing protein, partial [Lewinella sp.]|nr:helix-turn-helix domain-containing protein [Lewinella sp.]